MPGTISRSSSLQFYGATSSAPSTPDPTTRNSNGNRFSQVILSPTGTSYIGLPEIGTTGPGLGMAPMFDPSGSPYQLPRSPPPGSVATAADPYDPYATLVQQPPYAKPDEFGMQPPSSFTPRTSSLRNLNEVSAPPSPIGPRGGRFATFPVKGAAAATAQPVASGSSFSSPRLDDRVPSVEIERPDGSFSSSVAEALGEQWTGDEHPAPAPTGKGYEAKMYALNRDYSPPPPQYSAVPDVPLGTIVEQPTGTEGHGSRQATETQSERSEDPFRDDRPSIAEDEDEEESALAYMSPPQENQVSLPSESSHGHDNRRVRFDSLHDEPETPIATAREPAPNEMHTQPPPGTSIVFDVCSG